MSGSLAPPGPTGALSSPGTLRAATGVDWFRAVLGVAALAGLTFIEVGIIRVILSCAAIGLAWTLPRG